MSLPGGLRGHPAGSVLLLDTWEFGWALLAPASSEIAIATKILMMAILAPTTKETQPPVMSSSASGRRLLRVLFRKSEYGFVSLRLRSVCAPCSPSDLQGSEGEQDICPPTHRLRRWRRGWTRDLPTSVPRLRRQDSLRGGAASWFQHRVRVTKLTGMRPDLSSPARSASCPTPD